MTVQLDATHDGSADVHPGEVAPARSRRAVLAATLGALGGSIATVLARPLGVDAAAGDNLKLGQSNFAGTAATRLSATSSGGAFWMTQNGSGSGVRGDSTAGHGGVFTSAHPDRYGLLAQQSAASSGAGAALSADGGINTGVTASTSSVAANAMQGLHLAGGTGVYGSSSSGDGLFGESSSHYGVEGKSNTGIGVRGSSANIGTYGVCTASGYGVFGSCDSGGGLRGVSQVGTGALCSSGSGTGVWGESNTGYGVYGISSSSNAGYFAGTCFAQVFTTTNSPIVRVDHPLAPATRVLAHAAVVSDRQATLYAGTVTTDAAGVATVRLPAWFEAFNADVRYQLTAFADVRTWVRSKLAHGSFSIATSEPNTEVCWQLTAVRADVDALAHPIAVESAKTGPEAGHYLSPTEHGQPESAAVDWELRHRYSSIDSGS